MKAKSVSRRSVSLTFIYLLLLIFGTFLLSGCGNSQPTIGQDQPKVDNSQKAGDNQNTSDMVPSTAKLTVDELEAAMEANKGWQLIDIREPREFAAGHIKMAINRPLGDLEKKITQISKDKDIVLIDLNGTRSETAWQLLVKSGYDQNKIKVLTGGMLQWNGIVSSAGSSSSGENSNSANNNNSAGNAAAPKPEVQSPVGGC